MALKTEYEIRCSCRARFTAPVCEYILVDHNPELRAAILSGDFNQVVCPSCDQRLRVEIPFLYRDEKNSLFVWVCAREDEPKRKKLEKELIEKKSSLECHFLEGAEPGKEMLVFGREALIRLLLQKDLELKKREEKRLRKNPAVQLVLEEDNVPGCLMLHGENVRVAIPLAFSRDKGLAQDGPVRKKWLKHYSMGVNLHNPYSSLLASQMKKKWERVRQEEPLRDAKDEFDDFASSWASFKVDPKGFRARFPERRLFFDSLKGMEISRKVQSLRIGALKKA